MHLQIWKSKKTMLAVVSKFPSDIIFLNIEVKINNLHHIKLGNNYCIWNVADDLSRQNFQCNTIIPILMKFSKQ